MKGQDVNLIKEISNIPIIDPIDTTVGELLSNNIMSKIEALIRTEKLKLLAEVRERVVGEDEPGVTNIMIAAEHAKQRIALTKLEAEL